MAPPSATGKHLQHPILAPRPKLASVVLSVSAGCLWVAVALVAWASAPAEAYYLRGPAYGVRQYNGFDGPEPWEPDSDVTGYDVMGQPSAMRMSRRQDFDSDDDMEGRASAPSSDGAAPEEGDDGFGEQDNPGDGSYDETPREADSQADLERFFDDHLGASERDGMDKENLPTNLRSLFVPAPEGAPAPADDATITTAGAAQGPPAMLRPGAFGPAFGAAPATSALRYLSATGTHPVSPPKLPSVQTSFLHSVPDRKLIITRQITHPGPVYKGGFEVPSVGVAAVTTRVRPLVQFDDDQLGGARGGSLRGEQAGLRAGPSQSNRLDATGSEVYATEDDNADRVYVTNKLNKPFKIAALGGFDPEADFRDATRDIEESRRPATGAGGGGFYDRGGRRLDAVNDDDDPDSEPTELRRSDGGTEGTSAPGMGTKDISFHDEADDMFNDASENDEIIFRNDPSSDPSLDSDDTAPAEDNADNRSSQAEPESDEIDTNWVNDGVDDMEVPSDAYQEAMLDKAAKQEAASRQAAAAEEAAAEGAAAPTAEQLAAAPSDPSAANQAGDQPINNQGSAGDESGEDQRMPNADYLRNDMKIVDDEPY